MAVVCLAGTLVDLRAGHPVAHVARVAGARPAWDETDGCCIGAGGMGLPTSYS